jgi:hypothetical protein
MTTPTTTDKLTWYERFMKSLLDDWVAPICCAVEDCTCIEPSLKKATVALEVPGVTQVHTYSCGATASWSVLRALGWRISLRKWIATCHAAGMHPDEGMDERQLNKALMKVGAKLRTIRYRGREQLTRLIDTGQPALFGWDDNGEGEGDHWMYVYGYERKHVLVGNIVRPLVSKGRVKWEEWRARLVPRELYTIEAR